MTTIALCGIKGGVGKSTAAVNLAVLAAMGGERTLLWDVDAQGACAFQLGMRGVEPARPKRLLRGALRLGECAVRTPVEGLSLVPSGPGMRRLDVLLSERRHPEALLRKLLVAEADSYRWVLLDCPPGLTLLTECVLLSVDLPLVPVVPTALSVRGFEELALFAERRLELRAPLVPFFSLVEERRRLHALIIEGFRAREPATCRSAIPRRAEVERAAARGRPVVLAGTRSRAAEAYARLWEEVRDLSTAAARKRPATRT